MGQEFDSQQLQRQIVDKPEKEKKQKENKEGKETSDKKDETLEKAENSKEPQEPVSFKKGDKVIKSVTHGKAKYDGVEVKLFIRILAKFGFPRCPNSRRNQHGDNKNNNLWRVFSASLTWSDLSLRSAVKRICVYMRTDFRD